MASKGKERKRSNGKNCYQHNGASTQLTFGEAKVNGNSVTPKTDASPKETKKVNKPSKSITKFIDTNGDSKLLKIASREISVYAHDTAKASDQAYISFKENEKKASGLEEEIKNDKTPRNATSEERETLKKTRAELRKERKIAQENADIEKMKAIYLENATDNYAIVLSELLGGDVKEYKREPRLTPKKTTITDEERYSILEMFLKGRKQDQDEEEEEKRISKRKRSAKKESIPNLEKVASVGDGLEENMKQEEMDLKDGKSELTGDRKYPDKAEPEPIIDGKDKETPVVDKDADKAYKEHQFDSKEDKEMLKSLGSSEVAEIDIPSLEATGDSKYPDKAEPEPIIDGKEKKTPAIKDTPLKDLVTLDESKPNPENGSIKDTAIVGSALEYQMKKESGDIKGVGDSKYPDKAEPESIIDGEYKETPEVKNVDNPYEINPLNSKEAKSYLKHVNGSVAASIMQNDGTRSGDAEFPSQSKPSEVVKEEKGEKKAVRAEKKFDKALKEKEDEKKRKREERKSLKDNKNQSTALLNMQEEDSENGLVALTEDKKVEEKPLMDEVETPTVGIPVDLKGESEDVSVGASSIANEPEEVKKDKEEEKDRVYITVPYVEKKAAAKKAKKKTVAKKDEKVEKENELLDMSKEDKENEVAPRKEDIEESGKIEEKEAKVSEDSDEREVKGEKDKVEPAEPITDGVKDDSVSGIDGNNKTKKGNSKRAIGKIITAIILIILIILFGVWECHSEKGTKESKNTTVAAVVADAKESKKSNEIGKGENGKAVVSEAEEVGEMNSLDNDATLASKADAAAIVAENPPEFKIETPKNVYPIKMSATVEGIPISVNAYNGYAYVTYPENISDEEVDLFMDYLVNQQPSGFENIGWTLEDKGVMIIGYPFYNSSTDVINYGDQILATLDGYILASK